SGRETLSVNYATHVANDRCGHLPWQPHTEVHRRRGPELSSCQRNQIIRVPWRYPVAASERGHLADDEDGDERGESPSSGSRRESTQLVAHRKKRHEQDERSEDGNNLHERVCCMDLAL